MKQRPKADIVICGLGWAGSIMLSELASTGLKIVGFDRGNRASPTPGLVQGAAEQDDLQSLRSTMLQDLSRETVTFRHTRSGVAKPMRRPGAFLTGEVVGGGGVVWNGIMTRFLPRDFRLASEARERQGKTPLPDGMLLQDFGVSYEVLERGYDCFEAISGTSGQAGNLRGRILPGGNVFEGARSNDYPNPPLPDSQSGALFRTAASSLGYHPYPLPASNASRPYVNPHGAKLGACVFCGFCDRFRCPVDAKASPHITLLPMAEAQPNVALQPGCRVLRVELDKSRQRATGVVFVDEANQEWFQPAELVILSAYTFPNVHLLLHSGIGQPYDPRTGTGVVGRSYTYHVRGGATLFFGEDTLVNGFMGSGGLGTTIDDFNADSFDSIAAGFYGGAMIGAEASGARPIRHMPVPAGTPRWGAAWKQAAARHYNHTARLNVCGASMAHRDNYLDLDPNYTDEWGRPLLRMNFDYKPNDIALSRFMTDRSVTIGRAMGAQRVDAKLPSFPYDPITYQGSHNTGGANYGHGSRLQRRQRVPAELGRAERICRWGQRLPAIAG